VDGRGQIVIQSLASEKLRNPPHLTPGNVSALFARSQNAPTVMRRGEGRRAFYRYDIFDIKVADFREKNDQFSYQYTQTVHLANGTALNFTQNVTRSFRSVNLTRIYAHFSFSGTLGSALLLNNTIR
jgi:antirestriction protein ArdC